MGGANMADAAEDLSIVLIPLAAPVYGRDGRKLGHVAAVDGGGILVERGFVVLLRCCVAHADVDRCDHGRVVLRRTREEVLGITGDSDTFGCEPIDSTITGP